jgi:DNA-binding GntR family transcriptional regulator
VFFLIRVALDADGRPVETCEYILSGDRWQVSDAWEAD